ncbi:MAG: hypothetical protein GY861_15350 [bacterium]|nr:hypothetical protein [bacterium]
MNDTASNGLAFIKEVAKYFMDFLETDFHKRRNPKRTVKLRSDSNLLVGIDLAKYPTFSKATWKTIAQGFDKGPIAQIGKGAYQANIPQDLLQLITLQRESLTIQQVDDVLNAITESITMASTSNNTEYDQAILIALESTETIIKEQFVLPFISNLEKPLKSLNLGDENTTYMMEEELTGILIRALEDKIASIVRLFITGERPDVANELSLVFNLNDVKNEIASFFNSYQVKDLYAELYEIDRNKNILDKQDTYLYFCDISFRNAKYPIFYIPFAVERQMDQIYINFDSEVYINKKALEYIVQEYNAQFGKKGSLQTIGERILYLSQYKNDFLPVVDNVINEIINFFELDAAINIKNSSRQVAKGPAVRVSNSCYFNLADKSDEALINDYEEILQLLSQDDSVLGEAFNKLIDDFIRTEPKSFNGEIEDEWDDASISDRLVFESPIPLNSEQRQIIAATRKDDCKYITVEGPPGTGKSHTITAIAFDAILENKSILVLSDKKEALDVVEDKITQTMNQVRYDKKFQNPILRLGKTGNTYNQILSSASIENIKTHHRVIKKEHKNLKANIQKEQSTLHEDIEAEVLSYGEIDMAEIIELIDLESFYTNNQCLFDLDEALQMPNSAIELEEFRGILCKLNMLFADTNKQSEIARLLQTLDISISDFDNLNKICRVLTEIVVIIEDISLLKNSHQKAIALFIQFPVFSDAHCESLGTFVERYTNLKNRFFGYFLKGKKVDKLNKEFKQAFPHSDFEHPHMCLDQFNAILHFIAYAKNVEQRHAATLNSVPDFLKTLHGLFSDISLLSLGKELIILKKDLRYLEKNLCKYPVTLSNTGIDMENIQSLSSNSLIEMPDSDFDKMVRYINLNQKITYSFNTIQPVNYGMRKEKIEELVTAEMTYLLDGRVVNFYENSRATAKALRDIIKHKKRFPKQEFAKLKEAFPCILAGIRDYAEYIPLAPEIFDLVIIDEASQVSVAQAFPALLRAKKVIILGDKRQFSNVKAAQARSDTNRAYINNLESSFKHHVSQDQTKLVKLEKFNIKSSILEFFEYITNFNIQLMKYFRGYKEIISYSNYYFYQDSLQVMKIRGKPIDDVLKLTFVEHDGKKELSQNTNTPEIQYIISELQSLKENGIEVTVGIITPHTNQQKLAMELISKLPERDYFFDNFKLKIMTFDTCQGEERDLVFYSMVATNESDRLWGVFIKDLTSVDLEEESKIKAQRLNVGFSRGKECINLVLSKPLDKYNGAIGDALRHYQKVLLDAKKERTATDVDSRSAMEPAVLNWFYQTKFWKQNRENIDFIPGFEIGKYLRQLDKTYQHPNYIVDFLLVYRTNNREHKIIIEYDGFKEHFQDVDNRNEFRHDYYYSEEDVYREKVLISYGYKFLRINKFNVGKNPIDTLDHRIDSLLSQRSANTEFLDGIHETIESIQNGAVRQCPKCKENRDLDDFKDDTLISGWGKICNPCKKEKKLKPKTTAKVKPSAKYTSGKTNCPRCGSRMVIRNGRYGEFRGCSKFPYCRGTRKL